MIVFTWISTDRGGAERSIRITASAIRAEGHAAHAVELRLSDASYGETCDESAKVCHSLAEYEQSVAELLSSGEPNSRVLVSNHRSLTVDAELARKARARLFVVIRGTPAHGELFRILGRSDEKDELKLVSWTDFVWPESLDERGVVFPSRHAIEQLKKVVGRNASSIVPNPIDDIWFQTGSRTYDYSSPTRFISASRFIAWKGMKKLATEMSEVLTRCTSSTFVVFGSGPELPVLENCASSSPGGRFLVSPWNDALWDRYAENGVYVSCSNLEVFGRAGAEAMAVGLPLIVPSAGGLGQMVRDGRAGITFDVTRDGSLADAAMKWLRLPAKSQRNLGMAARQFADQEFRAEVVAKRWIQLAGLIA